VGQRGPIQDPNSRRGRAEIRKRQRLAVIDGSKSERVSASSDDSHPAIGGLPTCDKCLPRRVQEIYHNLVVDLAGAKVPIKQIDSHAITMAARCLDSVEEAERLSEDAGLEPDKRLSALRLKGQFGKDLMQWLQLICATPGARARIGLKPAPEKKTGMLAQMMAAKRGMRA